MSTEPLLSSYFHRKAAQAGKPCSGTFELTPRCNFNCKMCYVHLTEKEQQRRGRELTADEWLSIGEQACREGMLFLLLTGGEPTLRPDFMPIYSGLKRLGILVSINSNGYLLQGELLQQLLADPPHRVNITLYGTSNETYEALCGNPAYDTVLQNIRTLREAEVDVKLNLTLAPENLKDRESVAAKARELGAHLQTASYLFPPVRITGSSDFPQRMPPEQAAQIEAERLRNSMTEEQLARFLQTLELPDDPEDECRNCRAGRSAFWLSWDGKLMPCGMMPEPSASVRELGFAEAWRQVRDRVHAITFPEQCRHCRHRELCHICLAKCYTETLGFTKPPEYACRMTKATLQTLQKNCKPHQEDRFC